MKSGIKRKREKEKFTSNQERRYNSLDFPHELIMHILSFLDVSSIINISAVNKQLNAMTNDEILWKSLFVKNNCRLPIISGNTYRQHYIQKYTVDQFGELLAAIKNDNIESIKLGLIRLKDHLSPNALAEVLSALAMFNRPKAFFKMVLEDFNITVKDNKFNLKMYLTIFDLYAFHNNIEMMDYVFEQNPEVIKAKSEERLMCAAKNHAVDAIKWISERIDVAEESVQNVLSHVQAFTDDIKHCIAYAGNLNENAYLVPHDTYDNAGIHKYISELFSNKSSMKYK